MGEDSFRSHMNYPVNYWQAQIQTFLPDGRTFGLFLGDGIGSHLPKKTSEDFMQIDGKIIKLGMSSLWEDQTETIYGRKKISVKSAGHGSCELSFKN
jgi:hypothetical protein